MRRSSLPERPVERARLPHGVERVVAHLLQPGDEGEHVPAPLDPGRAADVGHHRVDRRLVEGRLLDRERAELGRVLPRRQVGEHVRVDLPPAKEERLRHPHERLLGLGLGPPLDRRGDEAAKAGPRAEQAGVQDVHDRPQVVEPVLDGRAGERDPVRGVHLPGGLGGVGERVLDGLGLVEHEHAPLALGQEAAVAGQERVRGEDDVPGLELPGVARAVGAVMDVDGRGRVRTGAARAASSRAPTSGRRSAPAARRRRRGRAGRRSPGRSFRGPCRRRGARPGRARGSS